MFKKILNYRKPVLLYGVGYIILIFIFAAVYSVFPVTCWGSSIKVENFVDGLYYSVVTITTLGFGDVFPTGSIARIFTCLEVLLGVVAIGLFLNAVATEQAILVDDNNKQSQDRQAKAKMTRHIPIVLPKIRSYLLECYEVVTPISKRNLPEDIFNFRFDWKFNEMCDLYSTTLTMLNPLGSSVISNYFRSEHELCADLRYINSATETQRYPQLQDAIYTILNECSSFLFEQYILDISSKISSEGKPLSDFVKEMIKKHKGEVIYVNGGNMINPYISLHNHLTVIIPAAQRLAKEMTLILAEATNNRK